MPKSPEEEQSQEGEAMERKQENPEDVVRALRHAAGMSHQEFAEKILVTPSTAARWESGRAEPSRLAWKSMVDLADQLGDATLRDRVARFDHDGPQQPREEELAQAGEAMPSHETEILTVELTPDELKLIRVALDMADVEMNTRANNAETRPRPGTPPEHAASYARELRQESERYAALGHKLRHL